MSDIFEGRVFNSIEEINTRYGVELELPEDIPEGCNLLCYKVLGLYDIELIVKYKEAECLYAKSFSNNWDKVCDSLEDEIRGDINSEEDYYIYLILNNKDRGKEVFKPERLLGVETTRGFVTAVRPL